MDCQLGSVIRRLDAKKQTQDKREGGGEHRDRDEKREPGKKYHLFFRDKEDKNVSSAQRQNVSRDSGCERTLRTGGRKLQGAQRGKGERADKREVDRWKTGRCERERERVRESEEERGPEIGSGSGASALGTLTSGGDMTRHAGSAQLGQRSALPCSFGLVLTSLTNTHTHAQAHKPTNKSSYPQLAPSFSLSPSASYLDTHSLTGKHTQAHTQNAMVLASAGRAGEGPGLMETPNSLL